MNKVGLLTIHNSVNYGATLQAYALYSELQKYSKEVKIIDYNSPLFSDLLDIRKYNYKNFIFNTLKLILFYKQIKEKHIAFNKFNDKYFKFTKRVNEVSNKSLSDYNFSTVVCGSDQIWNPFLTNQDTNYFFSLINDQVYKASYAASICLDNHDLAKGFLAKNLKFLNKISVREKDSQEYLQDKLLYKTAKHVLDPVFLKDKKFWENLAVKPKNMINEDYILLYALEENAEYEKILEDLKKKENLKIVVIQAGLKSKYTKDYVYKNLGPEEYLYLFSNAKYVVTNSFHGTAFGLIFNKKLIVFENEGKNIRMNSILKLLDLENLMVKNFKEYNSRDWNLLFKKDYEKKLNKEITLSKEYIKEIFNK